MSPGKIAVTFFEIIISCWRVNIFDKSNVLQHLVLRSPYRVTLLRQKSRQKTHTSSMLAVHSTSYYRDSVPRKWAVASFILSLFFGENKHGYSFSVIPAQYDLLAVDLHFWKMMILENCRSFSFFFILYSLFIVASTS